VGRRGAVSRECCFHSKRKRRRVRPRRARSAAERESADRHCQHPHRSVSKRRWCRSLGRTGTEAVRRLACEMDELRASDAHRRGLLHLRRSSHIASCRHTAPCGQTERRSRLGPPQPLAGEEEAPVLARSRKHRRGALAECDRERASVGVTAMPREESPSDVRRTTASPRLGGSPAARTGRRLPRYSFARNALVRARPA
jgi:hypothetical protein